MPLSWYYRKFEKIAEHYIKDESTRKRDSVYYPGKAQEMLSKCTYDNRPKTILGSKIEKVFGRNMRRGLKRERSLSSLGAAKYNIENVLGDYTCQIWYNTANLRRSLFSTWLGSVWWTLWIFENIFFRKNWACINHYLPLDELIPEKYALPVDEEALWKKREQLGITQRQGNNLNCPTCDNPFLFIGYWNILWCRIWTTGHHVKYQQRNVGKKIISTEMALKKKLKPDNIAVTEQMQRFTDLTLTESNSIDLYHILNGPLLYPLCYHLFKESIEKMLLKQQDALKTHGLMASTKIIDQSDVLIIKKDKEIDQSLRLVPYRLGIRLWYQFIRPQSKERMRESSKIVLKNSKNLLVGIDFKLGNQSAITITEKSDEDEVAQDLLKEEAKTQLHGLEQKSLNLSDLKNWNKDLLKNQLRHENTEFDEINLTKDISTQTEAQVMSDEFEDTKETFEDSQETIENSQEIVGNDSKETYLVFLSQLCNTEALTKPDISLIGIAKVGEPCYVYLPTGEFHLIFYPASKDLRSFQKLSHKQEKEDLVLSMKEHKFLMNKIV